MYDYVIVHGSYGSPFENWFAWLASELEKLGKKVLVPQFPCGQNMQNYENWSRVLQAYQHLTNKKTTFIGHSLAPAFIVDYMLDNNLRVNNLFFVAPFYDKINIAEFDEVNTPFFNQTNLKRVADLSQKRICFLSDNDPYVPNELSHNFAEQIDADVRIIQNADHFNTPAGYTQFSQLLTEIINSEKEAQ